MTYRQWLREYRRIRDEAVPHIEDRLPIPQAAPVVRHVIWRRVSAAVAAAAVLACVAGYGIHRATLPPAGGATDSIMPVITLHRAVNAVALLHADAEEAEEVYSGGYTYVGVRTIHISNPAVVEGHASCVGVFYDTMEQTCFCADHAVRDALTRHGIAATGVYFHYYHPTLQRVLFTLTGGSRPSYCYDIAADTLHKLPVSLYHCPTDTRMGTSPYVVLPRLGGTRDELFLVDMQTESVISVLKNARGEYIYTPMDDGHLSTDGKYVFFTLSEGDPEKVNGPARTTVAYEIATGESFTFTGEIHAEIPDSTRLLINTPDGYAVYDLSSRTTTPFAEAGLPNQYRYYVVKTDDYATSFGVRLNYRLNVCDRTGGEETLLCEEFVYAHALSADCRYLYYYVRGEDHIRVRDMATGLDEKLPMDEQFLQETEQGTAGERSLLFSMWLDESADELLLGYTVLDALREDPEVLRQQREQVPYYAYSELIHSGKMTSIVAMESVLRRYPQYVTAYEGDGFIYLDVTDLRTDEKGHLPGNTSVVVEEYGEHTFRRVTHQGSIATTFSAGEPVALPADAEQQTRALLAELDIPLQPAEKDYPYYFKNGDMVMLLENISGEQARQYVSSYIVDKIGGYLGARMALESGEDMQELWDFLAFTDSLTYERVLSDRGQEDVPIRMSCQYILHLNMSYSMQDTPLIYLGEYNGKPILIKNECLAYITADDLHKWSAWMDKQTKKGHIN